MTVEQIRKEVFHGAVNEHRLKPITPGQIEVTGLSHGSDLQFVVSFEVEPDVELARIGGFRIRRPPVRVTDDHVAATLDGIRAKMGTWIPEDSGRPGDGDHVSVRILDTGAGRSEGDAPRTRSGAGAGASGRGDRHPEPRGGGGTRLHRPFSGALRSVGGPRRGDPGDDLPRRAEAARTPRTRRRACGFRQRLRDARRVARRDPGEVEKRCRDARRPGCPP